MQFNEILIVCVGNICRSPMAEAVLKQTIVTDGTTPLAISSAGLGALIDSPPDPIACDLMLKKRIAIFHYRARQVTSDMLRKADLILVMEASQKTVIEKLEPFVKGKVFRLGHWGDFDIPDPYQQGEDKFIAALALIEQGVKDWVANLQPQG